MVILTQFDIFSIIPKHHYSLYISIRTAIFKYILVVVMCVLDNKSTTLQFIINLS